MLKREKCISAQRAIAEKALVALGRDASDFRLRDHVIDCLSEAVTGMLDYVQEEPAAQVKGPAVKLDRARIAQQLEESIRSPRSELTSHIVQIVVMGFLAPNNGDCHKIIALCEDGSLWEQWHSMGHANVPNDGLWRPLHGPNCGIASKLR